MATIHHQPYHHSSSTSSSLRRHRRHSLDSSSSLSLPSTTSSSSITPLKHTLSTSNNKTSLSTSSLSTSTTTTPTTTSSTLDTLERHLAAANFRLADDETRRLLIVLAGEPAIKRGYVFFSEVQFIPKEDLQAIDSLWTRFSNGRFGYSVQKKIWTKVNKDFTRFFMQVGWMKKLDTEIEQFNYRSFPSEFFWEYDPTATTTAMDTDTANDNKVVPPEGHLPLTNALRGTQLLTCIFNHPAFAEEGEEEESGKKGGDDGGEVVEERESKKKSGFASLRDRLFKPNYSF